MATKKPPPEAGDPLLDDDEDLEDRADGQAAWRASKWTKQHVADVRLKIGELTRALIQHSGSTACVDPQASFYAGKILALDATAIRLGFKSIFGDKGIPNG